MSQEREFEIKSSVTRKWPGKRERRKAKWSWRPRISLRNWMLLMLTSALWAAWYFKPQPVGQTMPGAFQLYYQETKIKLADNSEYTVVNGPLEIRDREGRLVGRGQFDLGVAVGDWTYYYPNRGLRFGGPVRFGQRVGKWSGKSRRGRTMAEISHADSEYADRTLPSPGAQRMGTITAWRVDGHKCLSGQYTEDFPSGTWVHSDTPLQRPEQGGYVRGVQHGEWKLRDGLGYFAFGHRVEDPGKLVDYLIEEVDSEERRRWRRAIRHLVTLGVFGNRGLLASLETNDRGKQLEVLSRLPPGQALEQRIARHVHRLASGDDPELACHASLTLTLEPVTPTKAAVRRVLTQLIDFDSGFESVVVRVGEHHRVLVPCLHSLLTDEDERVRRMSLDLIAGVITHGPFEYSWEESRRSQWRMIEKAIRDASRSQDAALATAAHLLIEEWFSPAIGGFGNPVGGFF
jgi:hypothetical protein